MRLQTVFHLKAMFEFSEKINKRRKVRSIRFRSKVFGRQDAKLKSKCAKLEAIRPAAVSELKA